MCEEEGSECQGGEVGVFGRWREVGMCVKWVKVYHLEYSHYC